MNILLLLRLTKSTFLVATIIALLAVETLILFAVVYATNGFTKSVPSSLTLFLMSLAIALSFVMTNVMLPFYLYMYRII